nr:MAG TPA: hypothetical protein [Caudoviricetes sp.]
MQTFRTIFIQYFPFLENIVVLFSVFGKYIYICAK